ncbi:CIA30 family protein [Flavobacterium nackdongense]|uniref:CIA30 family protein n=2 Tax=Flavobacterium nackdongense TaxID=2547394 RepID=A0A4P6YIA5_9FLAO|nr:CIA30 family protein [Flavobacterium nackdongense]
MDPIVLVDFNKTSNSDDWNIVNDVVMGGRSNSQFGMDSDGHGRFTGAVSLENNGGFCSVQHNLVAKSLGNKKIFSIRIKGDGKQYQFRVKSNRNDYYSYVYQFQTSKQWEVIEIPISEMYASFRGNKLNIPNYDGAKIEQLAFLIANYKQESFELLIDKIEVK